MTYLDGKTGADQLIRKVLQDPALLKALAETPKPAEAGAAAPAQP
jgi:type VI secretion system protein ImpB